MRRLGTTRGRTSSRRVYTELELPSAPSLIFMMKRFLLFLALFSSIAVVAQDSMWQTNKVDTHFSILLPADPERIDTLVSNDGKTGKAHILKSLSPYFTLGVSVIPNKEYISQADPDYLSRYYKDVKEGFDKSARERGFKTTMSDTVIDNMKGISAIVYMENKEMRDYMFIVAGNMYSITAYPNSAPSVESQHELNMLLGSIRFSVDPAEEKKAGNKVKWQRQGITAIKIFFIVLIIGSAVVIIIRNKRKAQQ